LDEKLQKRFGINALSHLLGKRRSSENPRAKSSQGEPTAGDLCSSYIVLHKAFKEKN